MRKFRISLIIIILIGMVIAPVAFADETEIPERFNLTDYFDLTVKNQHAYGICVLEAQSCAIESHVKLKQKNGELGFITENPVFSALALDKSLGPMLHVIPVECIDAIINQYYNGEITTEQEAIRENKAEGDEFFREIEKVHSKYTIFNKYNSAGNFVYLDDIEKKVDENGISYYDNNFQNELSEEEVQRRRDTIKRTIMNNGAVVTDIYGSKIYWTTSPEDGQTINLLNMKDDYTTDHGVAIIGWDDNFSRMNFPEEIRPMSDGVYIAQNSWGAEWGRNGIFYISYEDVSVEDSVSYVYKVDLFEDENPPIILDEKVDDTWKITVSDNFESDIKEAKYIWTEHNREPSLTDEGWVEFEYNTSVSNVPGQYIWVYAVDNAGNEVLKSLKYDSNDIRWVAKDSNRNRVYVRGIEKEEICIYCDTLTQRQLWENYRRDNVGTSIFILYQPGDHKIYVSKYVEVDGEVLETRAKMVELNIADPWADEEDEEEQNNNETPENITDVNNENPGNSTEETTENNTNDQEKNDTTGNENETGVNEENNNKNNNSNRGNNSSKDNSKKDDATVIDIKEPEVVVIDKDNKKADVKPNSIVVKNENLTEVDNSIPKNEEGNKAIIICVAATVILGAGIATLKISKSKKNEK